jgi:hypothetical protein
MIDNDGPFAIEMRSELEYTRSAYKNAADIDIMLINKHDISIQCD